MIGIARPLAFSIGLILAASLVAAACGGGGGTTDAPPASSPDSSQSASEPPSSAPVTAPDDPAAVGPDLRVPGLAVYTRGVDIWLQRASDVRLLLSGSQRIALFTPALSPDGDRVAYIRFDQAPGNVGDIGSDLHIVDIDSGVDIPIRQHAREGEFYWSPAWSADGARLYYSHQVNDAGDSGGLFSIDIEAIDLDAGAVQVLRENASEPVVSADGETLAFVDQPAVGHILAVMDLASGAARTLLDTTDNLAFFRLPRFSPDGQWLAFLASGDGPLASAAPAAVLPAAWITNGVQDVWLIRPDGTGLTRLTTVLEDTPYFSWSADGRQILLRGAFGTYLVEVETRVTQTLGPGEFHGAHDWAGVLPEDAP